MPNNEDLAWITRDAKTLLCSAQQIKNQDERLKELLSVFESPQRSTLDKDQKSNLNTELADKLEELKVIQTESIEKEKKTPEFEKETFRIDSSGADWHEVTDKDSTNPFLKKFVNAGKKIKANEAGDVVEYLDGDEKWEQIFIDYPLFIEKLINTPWTKYTGMSKQALEEKYILTKQKAILMAWDPWVPSEKYDTFRKTNIQKKQLAGCWHPDGEEFCCVGEISFVWMVGGGCAAFTQYGWSCRTDCSAFGFSGRLLKD